MPPARRAPRQRACAPPRLSSSLQDSGIARFGERRWRAEVGSAGEGSGKRMGISEFRIHNDDLVQPALRIYDASCGAYGRLLLSGEFDLAGIDDFHEAIALVRRNGRPDVEIDLTRVTFCDSSGIGALVATARRYAADGAAMRVTGVRNPVRRVFEMMQ